jgi:biotin carboxyl carrier protein
MKTYKLLINNEHFEAKIVEYSPTHAKINLNGTEYLVQIEDDKIQNIPKLAAQEKAVPLAPAFSSSADLYSGEIRAPLPGVIVSILVSEGEEVKKGQAILIIEAMKMQSEIASPVDGKIDKILVKERAPVKEGDLLMTITGADIKVPPQSKPPQPSVEEPIGKKAVTEKILLAPLPGTIMDIKVKVNDYVREGDVVLVLEAMKMESDIYSPRTGKISKIYVQKGDLVQDNDPLIEFED